MAAVQGARVIRHGGSDRKNELAKQQQDQEQQNDTEEVRRDAGERKIYVCEYLIVGQVSVENKPGRNECNGAEVRSRRREDFLSLTTQ